MNINLNDLAACNLNEVCQKLRSITIELNSKPEIASFVLENVFHPKKSEFLHRLEKDAVNEEFLFCALKCFDDTLEQLSRRDTAEEIEASEAIGDLLIRLLYEPRLQVRLATKNPTLFALKTLTILNKISTNCTNYAIKHISELLGIARAHVHFGLNFGENFTLQKKLQRVQPSCQLPSESSADELESSAYDKETRKSLGKVTKKRKPRLSTKPVQSPNPQQQQQQQRWQILGLENIKMDLKTSDSDASELENTDTCTSNRSYSAKERQSFARVRQAALNLLGILARVQDHRILYAYWHGFFENTKNSLQSINQSATERCDLLYVALHDPNSRCRFLALQVASQLIFNSKSFLQQAECIEQRCSTTFTHFAHNLGLQVLSLFEEITLILSSESSLFVLTQALKCLAVLVQITTPFKRFQPRNFVAFFVKEVRRLINHRDATIQVAALMVLEFLIATPELTPEISEVIGMTHKNRQREQRFKDENAADLIELDNSFEEFAESDTEENTAQHFLPKNQTEIEKCFTNTTDKSWLLQGILDKLTTDSALPSVAVRIESLQVMGAMAQHFTFLCDNLDAVAIAIEKSIKDSSIDLRICGSRTLDTIAHQIGHTLLENVGDSNEKSRLLEEECLRFWSHMLPLIMSHLHAPTTDVSTSIKVLLCDALSNMGAIIFERQSFALQMNLIGFLSGIANDSNEDVTIRIAAVRALAVYVLFPSMRDNLVFIENIAESALCLANSSNLVVRIKALWSIGNISDALLIQSNNLTNSERISNELLWRMITTATVACNDNDKVRCNAVRVLGNLLRLLNLSNFDVHYDGKEKFEKAILKLIDCLRLAKSSAKVKWNTCYAIGNLLQNSVLFQIQQTTQNDFNWQSKLFPTLANVIVNNPNFKVRINAVKTLEHVAERVHFGMHFEILCKALLDAVEQSHNLDNFYEYNHRDQLQEQLCLAVSHLLKLSSIDDFITFEKHLESRFEIVRSTLIRVVHRMVPEKSAPILACTTVLQQQLKNINYTKEQQTAIKSIINAFDM